MIEIQQQQKFAAPEMGGSLYRSLVGWAVAHPEQPFLIEAETGRSMSYLQTLAAVNALRAFLGNQPRTLLTTLPGGILDAVLWISAITGGHSLVPLPTSATREERVAAARRYQPELLFVEQETRPDGFAASAAIMTPEMYEFLLAQSFSLDALEPVEGQVYLSTSGTTGEPKGVVLNERQIAWTANAVRSNHQLRTGDRCLTVLPFSHVNAPVVSLFASLLAGSTVVIARRFSRTHFWSWLERYKITWASIVPTIVTILLETERPAFLPGALRFMRTGSASLPTADLHAFENRFGIPVIETYGLSEAASQVTANPLPPAKHKAGSAGRPVGVKLRICAPRSGQEAEPLRDLRQGETGEICVSGPALITAYQHNAGKASFQDGWFRTGDLGYLDEEGYLFIKGRLREVINRGGENIAPREIEEVLQGSPLVREVAVVGRPDRLYGEVVVAYITARGTWSPQAAQQLRDYAAQRLSAYKVPVDFIVLDALPKNGTGKIERHTLRAREQTAPQGMGLPHSAAHP